jgi:hypothetical protein
MRLIKYLILIYIFISFSCQKNDHPKVFFENLNNNKKDSTIKSSQSLEGINRLLKTYPDFLEKADSNHLYWKDGSVMLYDDGKNKTYKEKLENPDLEDMMSQKYPIGKNWKSPPAVNYEPGRIRYESFFEKMYGESESKVKNNLTTIIWIPGIADAKIMVSKINNVDKIFKSLSDDLSKIAPEFHKYINKTSGTFNYRKISGTSRLSAHAYGIAIDINTEYSDYWQWSKNMEYKNIIPMEIVEIFEKHGFIWGGKWYHFDTMHFEYRPELIL